MMQGDLSVSLRSAALSTKPFVSVSPRGATWCGQDDGRRQRGARPRCREERGRKTRGSEAAGGGEERQICKDGGGKGVNATRHQRQGKLNDKQYMWRWTVIHTTFLSTGNFSSCWAPSFFFTSWPELEKLPGPSSYWKIKMMKKSSKFTRPISPILYQDVTTHSFDLVK